MFTLAPQRARASLPPPQLRNTLTAQARDYFASNHTCLTLQNWPCYTGAALSWEGVREAVLPGGNQRGKQLSAAMRMASVGIELAMSTVVGLLFGRWLDGKFGTDPYLMIVFLVIGVSAGFRSLFRTARNANQAQQNQDPNEPPE